MINIKLDAKAMLIEPGWYILVYDPRHTNEKFIREAIELIEEDKNAPETIFVLIPSYDPNSIRLLKTEVPGILKETTNES
jgi:hypothetical protein